MYTMVTLSHLLLPEDVAHIVGRIVYLKCLVIK